MVFQNFDSDEVDVQIFGELPRNIIEENVDLVSKVLQHFMNFLSFFDILFMYSIP